MADMDWAVGIRKRCGDECTFKIGHCEKFVFQFEIRFQGGKDS
jgi:hypothetical protein